MEAIMANPVQYVRLSSAWNSLQDSYLLKRELPAKVAFQQVIEVLTEMGYKPAQITDLTKLVDSILR
jgi:hypothetical protein